MKYPNTIALIKNEINRLELILENRIRQNYMWSEEEKERQTSLIRSEINEMRQAEIVLNSHNSKSQ